jgi:uncharacterized protein (UPF0332 family)
MPRFNWRDYSRLGRRLEALTGEAEKRAAISRCYYAAFNVAKEQLRADGIPQAKKGGSHQRVWTAYRTHNDARRKQIGLDGNRLKYRRVKADYHAAVSNIPREAARAVRDARKLLRAIDSL